MVRIEQEGKEFELLCQTLERSVVRGNDDGMGE